LSTWSSPTTSSPAGPSTTCTSWAGLCSAPNV
jgi:hypothetical protein